MDKKRKRRGGVAKEAAVLVGLQERMAYAGGACCCFSSVCPIVLKGEPCLVSLGQSCDPRDHLSPLGVNCIIQGGECTGVAVIEILGKGPACIECASCLRPQG